MKFFELPSFAQTLLLGWTMLLFIGFVTLSILSLVRQFKVGILSCLLSILLFASLFALNFSKKWNNDSPLPTPSWAVYLSNGLFSILWILGLIGYLSLDKNRLSARSPREAMDAFDVGICFYSQDGLPCLVNLKMNELSEKLTGFTLSDANAFYERLQKGDVLKENQPIRLGEQPIYLCEDKEAYAFLCFDVEGDKRGRKELLAHKVTELYHLSQELKKQTKEWEEWNRRLKEYGFQVENYIREKEILSAKMRVHDGFGKWILVTERKLLSPLSREEQLALIAQWEKGLSLIKTGQGEEEGDSLDEAESISKDLGVELLFHGDKPKNPDQRKLLFLALVTCLNNAVAHAHATRLDVDITPSPFGFSIQNNGDVPRKTIIEGGGLTALRKTVEKEGGRMEVTSQPSFRLTITWRE